MSTDDSETDEYELWTRRETLQTGGAAGAAMALPMSHSGGGGGILASVKNRLTGDPDLVVMHNGEVVTEDPKELNFEGSAIKEVTEVNDYDGLVRITLEGGSGSGGAFEDTDGDGVATLQDSHADFAGGDARNVGAVGADRQNGNEVNLTRLVEAETYNDILDAIANEPPKHTESKRFVIEPGSYTASTSAVVTYSNHEIVAYGSTNERPGGDDPPVKITYTGTDTSPALALGDGTTQVTGLAFEGIGLYPDTSENTGIYFDAASGAQVNNCEFKRCYVGEFAGNPVDVADALYAFSLSWTNCGFRNGGGACVFGVTNYFRDCYFTASADNGQPKFDFGRESQFFAGEFASSVGAGDDMRVRGSSMLIGMNIEGATGETGVVCTDAAGLTQQVGGIGPVYIYSKIAKVSTPIRIDSGPIRGSPMVNRGNTSSPMLDFQGGNNSHNGTAVEAAVDYADVNFANTTQSRVIIRSTRHQNSGAAITAADVPLGWFGFDGDYDGNGNGALIYGGTSIVAAKAWTGTNL